MGSRSRKRRSKGTLTGFHERSVVEAGRRAGVFPTCYDGRWEYRDSTTAKLVLSWFENSGSWTTPSGKRGMARSAYDALQEALALLGRDTNESAARLSVNLGGTA